MWTRGIVFALSNTYNPVAAWGGGGTRGWSIKQGGISSAVYMLNISDIRENLINMHKRVEHNVSRPYLLSPLTQNKDDNETTIGICYNTDRR